MLLRLLLLSIVTFYDLAFDFLVPALLVLLVLDGGFVDSDLLLEHPEVKLEFLFVELVDGLHVLHALLKNLHFFLKLDLLLSLVVCVVVSDILELLLVLLLDILAMVLMLFLIFLLLLEQLIDLVFIRLQDLAALIIE